MRAILQWHTRIGNLTTDNRDTYAHLDLPQASFYLVPMAAAATQAAANWQPPC